jgi:hypothetical protein
MYSLTAFSIRTSPADSWTCTVSIHEYYRYTHGTPREPTANNPFPPWEENATINIKQFKTISNKSELENVLRWAQIALLNPSQDHRTFIPGSGAIAQAGRGQDFKHEADYSPNIVALEISGPRLPALSFMIFLVFSTVLPIKRNDTWSKYSRTWSRSTFDTKKLSLSAPCLWLLIQQIREPFL